MCYSDAGVTTFEKIDKGEKLTGTGMADRKQPPLRPPSGFEPGHESPALWLTPFLPASPTTVTQISLSNPTMLRTHSLSNADGQYDPYTDSRFRNSSMSLDEKSRTMSRSGSFRDGFEEGKKQGDSPSLTLCRAVNSPLYRVHFVDLRVHPYKFPARHLLWGAGLGNSA